MKKLIALTAVLVLVPQVVFAATQYWDSNGATPGAGVTPTGTWGTSTFWSTSSAGTAATAAWTSGNDAVFAAGADATAYTVTVTTATIQTANSVTVEEGNVLISTGGVATNSVQTQTVVVNNNASLFTNKAFAFTVPVAGGTLTLNGPNATIGNSNTGTGGSFLGSGTANTNMGIVLNGGGHVSANGGAAIVSIYTGLISGSGPLVVDGSGVFRLTTTPATYSGGTTINGTLQISTTANVIPDGTDMVINAGGKFDQQANETIGGLSGAGNVVFTGTRTLTIGGSSNPGALTGTITQATTNSSVTRTGSGTLTLGGINTYNGTFTNTSGTTTVNLGGQLCGPICDVVVTAGTLNLNNAAQTIENLSGAGGTINLNNASLSLTTDPIASTTYSGIIAGVGGLTKLNANATTRTLTLAGANTYDGATIITAGKIQANNATALGSAVGNTQVSSTGELLFDGAANNFTTAENVQIAGAGFDGGAITVQNAANITLSGQITLSADASLTTSSTATAAYTNANAITGTNKNLTIQGGSGAGGGSTVSGAVSLGTGSVTKLQGGTWRFTNAAGNSYSGGTAVSAGTLEVTNTSGSGTGSGNITVGTSASGTTGTLNVGNGGAGGDVSGNIAFVNTSNTSNVNFNRTVDLTYAGVISGANGAVNKQNTNTLTFTGNHTYGGTTTISGGALSLGNGGTSGSIAGAIVDNATLIFNRSDGTLATPVTHSGAISGTGVVNKNGTGVLALTATNSYGGATNVNAGTLLVNGSNTGAGAVNVNTGATLGGTGSIAGPVNVNSGGTLSPGASIESLGSGAVTFSTGSTFKYEIDTLAAVAVGADLLNATGSSLSIAAGVNLMALDLNPNPNAISGPTYKYTMIAYSNGGNANYDPGTFAGYGELSVVTFTPGGKQFRIRYRDTAPGNNFAGELTTGGNNRFVTLTAVPELGSFITMGLVGCCAIGAVRLGKRFGLKSLCL